MCVYIFKNIDIYTHLWIYQLYVVYHLYTSSIHFKQVEIHRKNPHEFSQRCCRPILITFYQAHVK